MKRTITAAAIAGIALGIVGAGSMALAASAYMLPAPVAIKAKHHPKIVARPDRVRVHGVVMLTGSGFKPHAKLVINECKARFWIVPQQVCNNRNAVHVRTGRHGGFRVRMKVLLCPRATQPQARVLDPQRFVVHCFIGMPKPEGVDTITLVGAVRIAVTGR